MSMEESLQRCPQCNAEVERMRQAVQDIAELAFCLHCHFPLLLIAGKYRLQRQIGRGGFGEIFLAHHVHLPRDTERVIKILKAEMFADKDTQKRFHREVHLTSLLSRENTHIVRIYDDFGEVPKLGHFYVMEYLQGVPLTRLLDDPSRLPPLPLCFHIFRQLCEAMEAAHRQGVVHRDLKPDNIFLIRRQNDPYFVKVIDFGIAKPLDRWGERSLVATQGVLGTPLYMAPEQWDDTPVDHRTDIYAMGVVLYEMLTGRTPFWDRHTKRSPRAIMTDHLMSTPPPLAEANPDRSIPPAIEQIVLRALSKDPARRFSSVRTWRQDLQNAYVKSRLWPVHGWRSDFSPEEEWGPLESYLPPSPTASSPDARPHFRWPRAPSDEWQRDRLQSFGQVRDSMAFVETYPVEEGLREHPNAPLPSRRPVTSPQSPLSEADAAPVTHDRARLPESFVQNKGQLSPPRSYRSGEVAFASQEFPTHRSGPYDLNLLHGAPPDEPELDDLESTQFQASPWLFWGSMLLMIACVWGAVWFLLQLHSQRSPRTQTSMGEGICGPPRSQWKPHTLRVLILPLVSQQALASTHPDSSGHQAKRYMQSIFQQTLRTMFQSVGAVGREFLTLRISQQGLGESDPKRNQQQARTYGTNCDADLVLSGTWVTSPGGTSLASQPPPRRSPSPPQRTWLWLFATHTGAALSHQPHDPSAPSIKPKDRSELLQVGQNGELQRSKIRALLQGLVWWRAARYVKKSGKLQSFLQKRARKPFQRLGLKLPPLPPPTKKRPSRTLEAKIPEGPFWMGPPNEAKEHTQPEFSIDRFEVTREAYALCVLKGDCTPVPRWLEPPWNWPRDRVSPEQARNYCTSQSKKLPTEAQWVKAARGGLRLHRKRNPTPQRLYTWGNRPPTCRHANIHWCFKGKSGQQSIPRPVSVYRRLLDRSPYDVYHMMGNVAEILRDGSIKGGNGFSGARTISWKEHMDQRSGLQWVGFRCVRE